MLSSFNSVTDNGKLTKLFFIISILLSSHFAFATITSCGPGTGMLLVRGDGNRGIDSYCISQNSYSTSGQDWAATGCGLRGHLCSTAEYVQACLEHVIPQTPGLWHYTSDLGVGTYSRIQFRIWGGAKENSCISVLNSFPTSTTAPPTRPYRCCQR